MENSILHIDGKTIVMNGGNPLPGCPTDWDEARKVLDEFNIGKEEYSFPIWSFDCGFKLDYDGPLLRVSSRFYPPKTHYGATWDGNVSILSGDTCLLKKQFDCPTIEELRQQVEAYINEIRLKLKDFIKTLNPTPSA